MPALEKKRLLGLWWLLIPILVWFIHIGIIVTCLRAKPIQDERFYFPTALAFRNFPNAFSLDFLRTYDALQPPLAFLIGGFFLSIWNSLTCLRLLNATVTLAYLVRFGASLRTLAPQHPWIRLLAFGLLVLNPYVHLTAVLFYTDPIYLLTVTLVACEVADGRRRFWYYMALFCCPLARQYGVLFPVGNLLFELIRLRRHPRKRAPALAGYRTRAWRRLLLFSFSGADFRPQIPIPWPRLEPNMVTCCHTSRFTISPPWVFLPARCS